jgi:hypothetical protein
MPISGAEASSRLSVAVLSDVASDAEESVCDSEELVDVPDDECDVCGGSVEWRALDLAELPDDESAVDDVAPDDVDVSSAGGSADATPCPVAVATPSQIATTGKDERQMYFGKSTHPPLI